ncbi:alpha/beta hydrolase [Nonomuraea cavernae]|uniref:alpha/beta hydrolase n=1 Tax=Nonomuraea cavernae TaxID=2045107 RepID=UPI0033C18E32
MFRHVVAAGLVVFGTVLALPGQQSGRLVRVYGDLATAERVAIIVPGADTTVETFEEGVKRPGGAARAVLAEAARVAPGDRLAVVAWLGYDAPPTWSLGAVTDTAAVHGAKALRHTVHDLRARTAAPIALLCHSYGSVVCAKAVPGLPVADLAVFGSPGLGPAPATVLVTTTPEPAPSARVQADGTETERDRPRTAPVEATEAERSPVRLWAGLGANDWIRWVAGLKAGPLGFGGDPLSQNTRIFETGAIGHSDYFAAGTPSLRNLTLIALGRSSQVTPA